MLWTFGMKHWDLNPGPSDSWPDAMTIRLQILHNLRIEVKNSNVTIIIVLMKLYLKNFDSYISLCWCTKWGRKYLPYSQIIKKTGLKSHLVVRKGPNGFFWYLSQNLTFSQNKPNFGLYEQRGLRKIHFLLNNLLQHWKMWMYLKSKISKKFMSLKKSFYIKTTIFSSRKDVSVPILNWLEFFLSQSSKRFFHVSNL